MPSRRAHTRAAFVKYILYWKKKVARTSNFLVASARLALKEAIRQEVAAIPPAMTRKAMDNFRERLQGLSSITAGTWAILSLKVFEKTASYVLFINKRIFCVPCVFWFL